MNQRFTRLLSGLYLGGLLSLGAFLSLKPNSLSLGEGLETGAADCGVMNKNVIATILRGDKTKTFALIKPLYCTITHN